MLQPRRSIFKNALPPSQISITIRTVDTDVLIIALGSPHVWIEMSIIKKKNLRYISVNQIHDHFDEEFCKALPAFHAFTGCDYTASFNGKGKVTQLNVSEKNENVQLTFSKLSELDSITKEEINDIKLFVSTMYAKKKFTSVDEIRLVLFLKKYQPKMMHFLTVWRKMDAASLPP